MGRVDLASVAFDGLALLTLGSASAVAFARTLVRSALGLMGTLAGVAGLYMTLSADFLAVVQVVVYLGGASVVFLSAAALDPGASSPRSRRGAGFTMALLAFALAVVAAGTIWPIAADEKLVAVPSTAKIGHALLGPYALPLELVALILVTALIGALVVARRAVRPGATP
jgi:NAD(P)H-quinone oxidoreductase subunit 6